MRQIKRLFSLLLFLGLMVGAAYGFVWYQAKTFIDAQISAVAPHLLLSYQTLVIDPRGTLRLEQIVMLPAGYSSPIDLGSFSLHSDDPLFFFDPQGRLDSGDFPNFISMAFSDLSLDLAADFLIQAEPSAAAQLLHPSAVQLEALACADEKSFSASVMRKMGISRISSDFVMTLQADNDKGTLALFTEMESAGLFAIDTQLDMNFSAGYLKPATFAAANPRLKSLQFDYQDLGFFAKRDKYCAGARGVAEEVYREQHLELVKQRAKQVGMQVPPHIWDAYSESTSRGSQVNFGVSPIGGLGPEVMLELNAPHDLLQRLRIYWRVGSIPVDLTDVDWLAMLPSLETDITPKPLLESNRSDSDLSQDNVAISQNTVEVAPEPSSDNIILGGQIDAPDRSDTDTQQGFPGIAYKPPAPPEKRFRRTEFEQLTQYVYAEIRIFTYYGNKIEGRLEAVEGDRLKILHRVGQGMAIYPVDRTKLDVIEVLR